MNAFRKDDFHQTLKYLQFLGVTSCSEFGAKVHPRRCQWSRNVIARGCKYGGAVNAYLEYPLSAVRLERNNKSSVYLPFGVATTDTLRPGDEGLVDIKGEATVLVARITEVKSPRRIKVRTDRDGQTLSLGTADFALKLRGPFASVCASGCSKDLRARFKELGVHETSLAPACFGARGLVLTTLLGDAKFLRAHRKQLRKEWRKVATALSEAPAREGKYGLLCEQLLNGTKVMMALASGQKLPAEAQAYLQKGALAGFAAVVKLLGRSRKHAGERQVRDRPSSVPSENSSASESSAEHSLTQIAAPSLVHSATSSSPLKLLGTPPGHPNRDRASKLAGDHSGREHANAPRGALNAKYLDLLARGCVHAHLFPEVREVLDVLHSGALPATEALQNIENHHIISDDCRKAAEDVLKDRISRCTHKVQRKLAQHYGVHTLTLKNLEALEEEPETQQDTELMSCVKDLQTVDFGETHSNRTDDSSYDPRQHGHNAQKSVDHYFATFMRKLATHTPNHVWVK